MQRLARRILGWEIPNSTTEGTEDTAEIYGKVKGPTLSHKTRQGWGTHSGELLLLFVAAEVEKIHQVAYGGAI